MTPNDSYLQFVADHLAVSPDDLELIAADESTCTFTQLSTGRTHIADVIVGSEGPVVTLRD